MVCTVVERKTTKMGRCGFTVAPMALPEREPAEHRDPFENLHLDDGFVRAARVIETPLSGAAHRRRPHAVRGC